jgi:hypothetical protein
MRKSRKIAITALLTVILGGVLSSTAPAAAVADSPWGGTAHHRTITASAQVSPDTDATPGSSDDSPWGFH